MEKFDWSKVEFARTPWRSRVIADALPILIEKGIGLNGKELFTGWKSRSRPRCHVARRCPSGDTL